MDTPFSSLLPLDYSCTEAWIDSHEMLSTALSAIVFVHPELSRIAVRWSFEHNEPIVTMHTPRHTRLPASDMPLRTLTPEQLLAAIPVLTPPIAHTLASFLAQCTPLTAACSPPVMLWSARHESTTLGLGASTHFDPNYPDAVERQGADGLAEAERVFSALATSAPYLNQCVLRAGTHHLTGRARLLCSQLLSVFEADIIHATIASEADLLTPEISVRTRLRL